MGKAAYPVRMTALEYQRRYGGGTKNPTRVYKGRRNQEAGKYFEEMLNTACEKYSDEKTAKISKTVEPFRIVGVLSAQPKVYKCVQEKEAEPDYKGLLSTGRSIAFEAKHTENDRIEWGVVRQHQREHLEEHLSMNGLAYVVVSFGLEKFFRIPWTVWRDMQKLYGRKYLRPEEISDFEIPLAVYYGKPATLFLDGIERQSVIEVM